MLIGVQGLEKVFRQGFLRRRVHAVKGVSFQVQRGDIFGFLGAVQDGTALRVRGARLRASRPAEQAPLYGLAVIA